MNQKHALASTTILGILTTVAGTFGVPAVSPDSTTTQLVLQIVGLVLAIIGRWKHGDLTILPSKPPAPPVALVLAALGIGTFSGCVAPSSEQGKASQGGSTGLQPVVNVTLTFGRDVKVDGLSSGTAAPSAASEAQSKQDAKQDGKLDVSVPVDAAGAGKVLGAVKAPAAPVVVPAEIVPPAPVPAPAPTVPEAPAPAPVAPTGG